MKGLGSGGRHVIIQQLGFCGGETRGEQDVVNLGVAEAFEFVGDGADMVEGALAKVCDGG